MKSVIISVVHTRKIKLREMKELAWGRTDARAGAGTQAQVFVIVFPFRPSGGASRVGPSHTCNISIHLTDRYGEPSACRAPSQKTGVQEWTFVSILKDFIGYIHFFPLCFITIFLFGSLCWVNAYTESAVNLKGVKCEGRMQNSGSKGACILTET